MLSSKQVVRILLFLLVFCFLMPAAQAQAEDPVVFSIDMPIGPADLLLDSALQIEHTDMDCSHLVHYLYQRSGLDYVYANSMSLYEGVQAFRRVALPQPGDLVVWRGHVGIVVDPEEHTFVSALRSGVKVSSYVSHYWKMKGGPRFLHYVGPSTPASESSFTY